MSLLVQREDSMSVIYKNVTSQQVNCLVSRLLVIFHQSLVVSNTSLDTYWMLGKEFTDLKSIFLNPPNSMFMISSRGRVVLQIIISSLLRFKMNEEEKAGTGEPAKPHEGQQWDLRSGKSRFWQQVVGDREQQGSVKHWKPQFLLLNHEFAIEHFTL